MQMKRKTIKLFCHKILIINSSQGYLNVPLLGLEKLFGSVLSLGIPETADDMNSTNFTEVEI